MAWARVDDGFWCHPKVLDLSLEARGLWVSVLSWSCQQQTDAVPPPIVAMCGGRQEIVDELVECGMWVHAAGGWYCIHDWDNYQSEKAKKVAAGRMGGVKSGQVRRENKADNSASDEAEHRASVEAGPTRPDPTRTDLQVNPVVETATPTSTALALVASEPPVADPAAAVFDAWRSATGHHRAKLTKDRRDRIRRWLKAGYTAEDLADACRGVTLSEFHMGANDRHTVYDDIAIVLKDSRNIEKFIGLTRDGSSARGPKAKGMAGVEAFARREGLL